MVEATGAEVPPLMITRIFAAPPAIVFRAWSSAEHMSRWFCPEGFTVPSATVEFWPGGRCEILMRSSDGRDYWSKGHYVEIAPPESLAFTTRLIGANGSASVTAHTSVRLEPVPEGTRLTVRQTYEIHDASERESIDGAPEGWRTTLNRLEGEVARIEATPVHTAAHASFTIERTCAAPPWAVFRAFVDPAAKAKWFAGGEGYTVVERSMDVRPGGAERLVGQWANGLVTRFEARYWDVVPDERLVYAYEMHLDARKISVSLATVELKPAGAGTRVIVTEQGVFLDGYEDAGSREQGTGFLLDRLGTSLVD